MPADVLTTFWAIMIIGLTTWFTRGLPFLVFRGKKELPSTVQYLGTVLPASIMMILVVYCLRNIDFSSFPFGAAELVSLALVIELQAWRKNNFLSILAGTACYMLLTRTLCPPV